MSLFDDEIITVDMIVLLIIFILIAIVTFGVAEYFRRNLFMGLYIYIIVFIVLLPFNMMTDSAGLFVKIKFIIVNIPYLLFIFSLIALIPLQSLESNHNFHKFEPCSKVHFFVHKICRKIFKFSMLTDEPETNLGDDNNDIHGYALWFSWVFWAIVVVNMLVAIVSDFQNGYITNPICGLLLILPLNFPIPIKSLSIKKHEYILFVNKECNQFEFRLHSLSLLWDIVYTSWDCCVLFGFSGNFQIFLFAAVHLGVPLFRAILFKRYDLYLHYRTFALGFALGLTTINIIDGVDLEKGSIDNVDDKQSKQMFLIWGIINCLGAVVNLVMQIIVFYQNKKRNHMKKESDTGTAIDLQS